MSLFPVVLCTYLCSSDRILTRINDTTSLSDSKQKHPKLYWRYGSRVPAPLVPAPFASHSDDTILCYTMLCDNILMFTIIYYNILYYTTDICSAPTRTFSSGSPLRKPRDSLTACFRRVFVKRAHVRKCAPQATNRKQQRRLHANTRRANRGCSQVLSAGGRPQACERACVRARASARERERARSQGARGARVVRFVHTGRAIEGAAGASAEGAAEALACSRARMTLQGHDEKNLRVYVRAEDCYTALLPFRASTVLLPCFYRATGHVPCCMAADAQYRASNCIAIVTAIWPPPHGEFLYQVCLT